MLLPEPADRPSCASHVTIAPTVTGRYTFLLWSGLFFVRLLHRSAQLLVRNLHACLALHLCKIFRHLHLQFALRQMFPDALLHFTEVSLLRGNHLVQLDDMVSKIRQDEVTDLIRLERERSSFEFRHHRATRIVFGTRELVLALVFFDARVF